VRSPFAVAMVVDHSKARHERISCRKTVVLLDDSHLSEYRGFAPWMPAWPRCTGIVDIKPSYSGRPVRPGAAHRPVSGGAMTTMNWSTS